METDDHENKVRLCSNCQTVFHKISHYKPDISVTNFMKGHLCKIRMEGSLPKNGDLIVKFRLLDGEKRRALFRS